MSSPDPEQVAKIADRYIPRHTAEPDNPAPRTPRQANGTKTPAQNAAYKARTAAVAAKIKVGILAKAKARRPGRPSAYSPEHCDVVVQAATEGYSLTATAKVIGVDPNTLLRWQDEHPDFRRAVARAKSVRLYGYETQLIDIARNGGDSSRLGAVKFAMTNVSPEDWKERFESTSNVNVSLSSLITDAMKTIEHEATQPKRLPKPDEDE